jgi:hypothetical protein
MLFSAGPSRFRRPCRNDHNLAVGERNFVLVHGSIPAGCFLVCPSEDGQPANSIPPKSTDRSALAKWSVEKTISLGNF